MLYESFHHLSLLIHVPLGGDLWSDQGWAQIKCLVFLHVIRHYLSGLITKAVWAAPVVLLSTMFFCRFSLYRQKWHCLFVILTHGVGKPLRWGIRFECYGQNANVWNATDLCAWCWGEHILYWGFRQWHFVIGVCPEIDRWTPICSANWLNIFKVDKPAHKH